MLDGLIWYPEISIYFWEQNIFPNLLYIILTCLYSTLSQVSVVNALDMQVVVSTVPPTLVEENKDQLIR